MGPSLRGRKILSGVADESFREALRRTLEREGAIVSAHPGARSLLAAVSPPFPDACIIDVDLPDLAVEELVRRIREEWSGMPILLVSAQLLPIENGALAGLPVLPLPFRRKELLAVLQQILGSAQTAP